MKQFTIFTFLFILAAIPSISQEYSSSSIFAHNDYVTANPYYNAYREQVGFIEADVFLQDGKLLVSHTREELNKDKTLDALYLKPLQKSVLENKGNIYNDPAKKLTLMIDLKTEGSKTLSHLVKELEAYPELLKCKSLQVTISGDVPDAATWKDFPSFIHFDGRPGINYTADQLKQVSLISTDFKKVASWNGKGVPTKSEFDKIVKLRDAVHAQGKPLRFWAAPDFANAWITFMNLKIDVLGTDDVTALGAFLRTRAMSTYQSKSQHTVYTPKHNHAGKPPKNIILMIGDGTGLTQLYSAFTANHGRLNIFNIRDIGFSVTSSSDSYITDSAAGATAMACGKKTNNRFVGVDSTGAKLPSITEQLKAKGYNTAIISNGDITDATPAAFYAHKPERSMSEAIANDFLTSPSDILIGGGVASFTARKDGVNLLSTLAGKGYNVSQRWNAIESIQGNRFVVLNDSAILPTLKGRKDFLLRSIRKTLNVLGNDKKPFFIMEEGAQIDWGGHENNLEYVASEALDFDQAVGEALRFADSNGETLVIVTADHETGGLALIDGNIQNGYIHGSFSTTNHTAVPVPVFAYGPGSELFRGVYQNTQIYFKMLEALRVRQTR